MKQRAILELMADGEFHSGEVLGDLLGVSRTAVWKHLQKLEGLGLPLESVRGKGYRLAGGVELLDSSLIESGLSDRARNFLSVLDVHQSVASTNALAMEVATRGGGHGYVCLAEHQTQGRGRRGRQWVSPFGQSIYLSTLVEFDGGAAVLEGLSLAVGVALVRAIEQLGINGVGLKWPNDLMLDGRKLAGVLLEMTGDPAGVCQVVVGVGLNVAVSEVGSESIDQPWAHLADVLPGVSRNQLTVSVLNHLLPLLEEFQSKGFSAYRAEWESLHVHTGAMVTISTINNSIEGRVLGVSEKGALRLQVGDSIEEFNGGEVSLRLL